MATWSLSSMATAVSLTTAWPYVVPLIQPDQAAADEAAGLGPQDVDIVSIPYQSNGGPALVGP